MKKRTYCATLNGKSTTLSVNDWISRLRTETIFDHYGRSKILRLLKERENGRPISISQALGIRELDAAFTGTKYKKKPKIEFTNKAEQKSYDTLNPLMRSCLAKMARV